MARGYGYFEDSYTNFDYDAYITASGYDDDVYDDEDADDYDDCDAHEEELKLSGKWGK